MKDHVSLQERLKDLRVEKGLKLEELAEKTGISKSALASYENEENRNKEINHGNLITLADFYEVSIDYLFCRTENREQINTPLSELHLTDEAVALLKSGRINTRLLCEMMSHEKFAELMADAEIYVDGMATMRFHEQCAGRCPGNDTGRTPRSRRRPFPENSGSRSDRGRRFFLPCDTQNMGCYPSRYTQSP